MKEFPDTKYLVIQLGYTTKAFALESCYKTLSSSVWSGVHALLAKDDEFIVHLIDCTNNATTALMQKRYIQFCIKISTCSDILI